jgi:hypothetical protein
LDEDEEGDTNTIIMGDWNSVVGGKPNGNTCDPYGLGNRNKSGQMLTDFCERTGLVISNTWFKKPKRKLYTWKAPSDQLNQPHIFGAKCVPNTVADKCETQYLQNMSSVWSANFKIIPQKWHSANVYQRHIFENRKILEHDRDNQMSYSRQ